MEKKILNSFIALQAMKFTPTRAMFSTYICRLSPLRPNTIVVFFLWKTPLAPTQGSYFAFVVFRKQTCFGLEGVAKDKLVVRMLKHGHVSFQILT